MFFNQIFQAGCQREDLIFTSRSKSMSKSTAKTIEAVSKAVEFIIIYTFIIVEYHISIYDINGKSDLICHDKKSITIYTRHLVRQTVLTTCLVLYSCRLVLKFVRLFLCKIGGWQLKPVLQKENGYRAVIGAFIVFIGGIGMIIDNFNHPPLTTLYVVEIITGFFFFIWASYINRYNIKPEVQADPAVDVDIDLSEQVRDQVDVLRFDQLGDLKGPEVISSPQVNMIRPYFLGCIVRNVDLATPGNLEKILNLQNELHDEICGKRSLATIGIHDLSLITGNLVYDARDPDDIELVPLGNGPELFSARAFYDQLWQKAELERQAKRQSQLSDLHKYLILLQNQKDFPCLSDQNGHVISVPPLTSAERSKISSTSESIFIEITSESSMNICHSVMDSFLRQMVQLQLGQKSNDPNIRQILKLQQIRVIDEEGNLIITFPSSTDIRWIRLSAGHAALND